LKIMVTKTQMMVITKLQHIIIVQHLSKHKLFLTNTFNVAMFSIIDYDFVKQFRLILQRTNQIKVGCLYLILFFSLYLQWIYQGYNHGEMLALTSAMLGRIWPLWLGQG
jgi:hypothetical protein